MKQFQLKTVIGLLVAIVAGSACTKDYLIKNPETFISPEVFFRSEQDLSMYINGLLDNPGGDYFGDEVSDNATTTGQRSGFDIMLGNFTPENFSGPWTWTRLRDINYFLVNYQKAKIDDNLKNHYAGLARYYRARFYYDKILAFSDAPWYSGIMTPSDQELLNKPSDPRKLVMDSVMADLEFASNNVKESVPKGTPGKWAVKAVYARIALFEGSWRKYHPELNLQSTANVYFEKAKSLANEIMTGTGGFAIPQDSASYGRLFSSASLSDNKEVIQYIDYDVAKQRSAPDWDYAFLNYEMSASKAFIQSFLMKDGTRYTDQPGYQSFQFVKEFANRDPRLYTTINYPGWLRRNSNPPKAYVPAFAKYFTGYYLIKGYGNSSSNDKFNIDFPALRYAEVLLTYAEAAAELGTATPEDINRSINPLRKRAGLPDLNIAAANGNIDPVLAAQYPNVNGANKGLILEIRRERRSELAFEGYRIRDIFRWSVGKLMEVYPEGMYFPGAGKYDMTGDGVEDIKLIGSGEAIPDDAHKEKNALGQLLVYYKVGSISEDVPVQLKNGAAGGNIIITATPDKRKFIEPKYYYRPIPAKEIIVNPNLKQPFGW
ncbi:RagB/SusD family nutrient uptake outer membrane protein [Niabella drilacis]|uniref:SusD family protein n=1 Tax=Niabella drilacis (strain DSM 25811 / CCM 8410 / CCUG 62505 / LMG 26954 / E90) TaxID=1285928 RepID=A0A1G6NER7_NIADE|nr:RagB/SusD family nutrient uptake outer membrane protein [Niabella drilacis]SDC65767.1 SusD family protein [Niabella drilacis]